MHTPRHTSHVVKYAKLLLVLAVLLIALFLIDGGTNAKVAVAEAQFSDTSASGLALVPASGGSESSYTGSYTGSYGCVTPIEGGWDAYGRILYANYQQRVINFNGIYKCVSNNTGNTFFVPAGSNAETQSFINAAPGLNITVQ